MNKSLFRKILFSIPVMMSITQSFYGQELKFAYSMRAFDNNIRLLAPVSGFSYATVCGTAHQLSGSDMNILPLTYEYKPIYYPCFYVDKSPLHKGDYSVSGAIKEFRRGTIYGFGQQNTMIGIGVMNYAGAGYLHRFNDKFSIDVQFHVIKQVIPRFENLSFGTSGNFSYRWDDRMKFNVFGSYFITPSSLFKTYSYGTSLSLDITERFGMEVGVRRYYVPDNRKWETIPIVTPYYRLKNVELGIDVGGILQQVIYNWLK